MKDRLESLQALRFLAAALVAGLHIQQGARLLAGAPIYGGALSNIGSVGVDIFFVLSGYIIARTAVGKTPGEFLRLRPTRVVPVYWLLTLAYVPFLIHAGDFTWKAAIATFTFYPGLSRPWLKVGWTLCFEMLFYLATAWTLYRPRTFVPLALVGFVVCWILRLWIGEPFQFLGNPMILEFLAGAGLARLNFRSRLVGGVAAAAGIVSLGVIAVTGIGAVNQVPYLMNGELALPRVLFMGIPAICLVFAALQWDARWSVLSTLGDASYSLYLVHPILIAAATWLAPGTPEGAFTAVVFGLSVVASIAVYRWLEQPLIAYVRRPAAQVALA